MMRWDAIMRYNMMQKAESTKGVYRVYCVDMQMQCDAMRCEANTMRCAIYRTRLRLHACSNTMQAAASGMYIKKNTATTTSEKEATKKGQNTDQRLTDIRDMTD